MFQNTLNKKAVLFLTLILLCTYGCKKEPPKVQQNLQHSFGIYLIKDGKFTEKIGNKNSYYEKEVKIDINTAELLEPPIISDKDIIEYDWDTHNMTISKEAAERISRTVSFGIPFVVVADGKRCYIGGFWTMFSSVGTFRPTIEVNEAKRGNFRIRAGHPDKGNNLKGDPRFEKKIKNSLEGLGKLKVKKRWIFF